MSHFPELTKVGSEIPPVGEYFNETYLISQKKAHLASKNQNKLTPNKCLKFKLPILTWEEINEENNLVKGEEESTNLYPILYHNYE